MKITKRTIPTTNYDTTRKPIKELVLHWIGIGTLESADNRFSTKGSQVSAHYGISDKTIYQWVDEKHTAYAVGNYARNQETISIEHDATTTKNASEETYKTSGELVKDICTRHNIPIDRKHIIGHNQISATQCPGTLDIDKIIRIAKEGELLDILEKDIPSEVEDKFNLKSIKRYNKNWTYEDILSDWVNLTDGVEKQASKIKALERLHEDIKDKLTKDIKALELKVEALDATTSNQLYKINQLAGFEEKYNKLLDTYDQLSGEHRQLLIDHANLDKEINENYIVEIRELEKKVLELQRPTPRLSEAIKMCIEAFKKEVLGI